MAITTNSAINSTATHFFTKRSNRAIKKVSEFEFAVEKNEAIGMSSCEDLRK